MLSRRMVIGAGAALVWPRMGRAETRMGADGLHKQDWFIETFLELGEDLADAAGRGKGLMILYEQAGCPYCRELHRVNFAKPVLVDYLTTYFDVIQLDLWGAREVVDFDGDTLEERRLAAKWAVNFTPTTILIPPENAGKTEISEVEAFRAPGYLKPFHYLSALEYVGEGAWQDQPFQRFLQDKFQRLEERGESADVWDS